MEYQREITFAKRLASEAGETMRRYFQADDIGVEIKEDNTPITIADSSINAFVIEQVRKEFPDCGVIGEEDSFETEREKLWIVDPIDGTRPYSLGIPVSTFCLAYAEAGQVKASVVYDPFQDRLFSAVAGQGAFVNEKPIAVSETASMQDQYVALGGGRTNRARRELRDVVKRFELYSFAYAATLVAEGNFVAAGMEYGSQWDAAAASLIVQEAGGRVTDLDGNERDYSQWGKGILMTNGHVHDALLELIDDESSRD